MLNTGGGENKGICNYAILYRPQDHSTNLKFFDYYVIIVFSYSFQECRERMRKEPEGRKGRWLRKRKVHEMNFVYLCAYVFPFQALRKLGGMKGCKKSIVEQYPASLSQILPVTCHAKMPSTCSGILSLEIFHGLDLFLASQCLLFGAGALIR